MKEKFKINYLNFYLKFLQCLTKYTKENQVVQVRTGISYVSIENAALNLSTEIEKPFNWDLEAVRQNNLNTWNELFERIKITSNNRREKMRFYSNMYRALCSRNIFSDILSRKTGKAPGF